MKGLLSGLCALALLTGLAAGCTDSNRDGRLGNRPGSDRALSASPPTAPSDSTMGSSPGGSPAPDSTEAPKTPGAPGSGSR